MSDFFMNWFNRLWKEFRMNLVYVVEVIVWLYNMFEIIGYNIIDINLFDIIKWFEERKV